MFVLLQKAQIAFIVEKIQIKENQELPVSHEIMTAV
jgi:hypothetical protein